MVFNLALQYVQHTEDAEEITQDVFVKIFQKMDGFRNQSEMKTWIYRITINQSLDFLKAKKSKKRRTLFSLTNIETVETNDIRDFNHPGVALEQKHAVAAIMKCVHLLPEKQKTALILLKIEHLNQSETAQIMNLSPKAVESLFFRAKKNLLDLLTQNEDK